MKRRQCEENEAFIKYLCIRLGVLCLDLCVCAFVALTLDSLQFIGPLAGRPAFESQEVGSRSPICSSSSSTALKQEQRWPLAWSSRPPSERISEGLRAGRCSSFL